MPLTLDENNSKYVIKAYQPGSVKINNEVFHTSVILNAEKCLPWKPQSLPELSHDDFKILSEFSPDILILTTGEKLIFPELELYGDLINQGIGVEIMTSAAGARTFNALCAENRNVTIALLIS